MNEEQVCVVRRRRSRAEIERLVAEFEASGLSRSEFCRERGLALSTLGRYRRGRDRRESTSASPLLAVELSGRMQAYNAAEGRALEVVLRSGRRSHGHAQRLRRPLRYGAGPLAMRSAERACLPVRQRAAQSSEAALLGR